MIFYACIISVYINTDHVFQIHAYRHQPSQFVIVSSVEVSAQTGLSSLSLQVVKSLEPLLILGELPNLKAGVLATEL